MRDLVSLTIFVLGFMALYFACKASFRYIWELPRKRRANREAPIWRTFKSTVGQSFEDRVAAIQNAVERFPAAKMRVEVKIMSYDDEPASHFSNAVWDSLGKVGQRRILAQGTQTIHERRALLVDSRGYSSVIDTQKLP